MQFGDKILRLAQTTYTGLVIRVVASIKTSGKTKLLGVIGHPVGHSLSPVMHNAALEYLQLEYHYVALDIEPDLLRQGVEGLRAFGFKGFNVTVPHKEQVINLLDKVDSEAALIGAVNTVVNRDGELVGFNTDGRGFLRSVAEEWDFDSKGMRVVILGAGGAARAIAAGLAGAGVSQITLANRNLERGFKLKQDIGKHFSCEINAVDLRHGALDEALKECVLVVQTSPVGMSPKESDPPIIDPVRLRPGTLVYDIIFNPGETKFLQGAREQGCRTANGLGMLLHQGALALEYWTGEKAPVEIMRKALFQV